MCTQLRARARPTYLTRTPYPRARAQQVFDVSDNPLADDEAAALEQAGDDHGALAAALTAGLSGSTGMSAATTPTAAETETSVSVVSTSAQSGSTSA